MESEIEQPIFSMEELRHADSIDYAKIVLLTLSDVLVQPLGSTERYLRLHDLEDVLYPERDDELTADLKRAQTESDAKDANGEDGGTAFMRGYLRSLMALMDRKGLLGEKRIEGR